MKEKTLLKIAIISALAGIFILYLISDNIVIGESSIAKIENEEIGSDVKVKGIVNDVFNGEKISIITITQPSDMKIVLYDNVSIAEGDYIEVIGEIDEYNMLVDEIEWWATCKNCPATGTTTRKITIPKRFNEIIE